jgi:hypothetical protein
MHSTQFINKSSQIFTNNTNSSVGARKMIDFYENFYKIIVRKRQVSGSVLILEYGQNHRLTIYQFAFPQANSDCIKRLSPIFGTEW